MRVLLVQPKIDPRIASLGRLEPLGLETLAAAIPDHEVRIFDYRFERSLTNALDDFRPRVVGVTAVTVEFREAVRVTQEVKAFSKDILVVVGGCHATLAPEDFCLSTVDAIVIGLGHHTFSEMIASVERREGWFGIPGLALPDSDGLRFTNERPPEESFAQIPNPDRKLTERYRRSYGPAFRFAHSGVAITTLGCPARCNFCTTWTQNRGVYLEREPAEVVVDILSMREPEILLADDNSLHNPDRAWEICGLLREHRARKRIIAYARADTIANNPDLMNALKTVGFYALIVGYEAISESRLEALNKGCSVDTNRRAMNVLREAGIRNIAMFVIVPDFSREEFRELARFVESERLWAPRFTVLTPEPGTPFYKKVEKDLLVQAREDPVAYDFTHCVLPTRLDYMTFFDEYENLFLDAYSKSRYIKEFLDELRSFCRCRSWPKTERVLTPFANVLLGKHVVKKAFHRLRNDYEALARISVERRISPPTNRVRPIGEARRPEGDPLGREEKLL